MLSALLIGPPVGPRACERCARHPLRQFSAFIDEGRDGPVGHAPSRADENFAGPDGIDVTDARHRQRRIAHRADCPRRANELDRDAFGDVSAEGDGHAADRDVGYRELVAGHFHDQSLDEVRLPAHDMDALVRSHAAGEFPPGEVDVIHVEPDRIGQGDHGPQSGERVHGGCNCRVAVAVGTAHARSGDESVRIGHRIAMRIMIELGCIGAQLDLGSQRVGRCGQVHDAVRRIPLVVGVVVARLQIAEGRIDRRLRLQILQLDLWTDELAIELQHQIPGPRKIDLRSIHRAAIHREPILGWFGCEAHAADSARIRIAVDVPFAILDRGPEKDVIGQADAGLAGAGPRRHVRIVAPIILIGRHRPKPVGLDQRAPPAETAQQFLGKRIPEDGLLDRRTRVKPYGREKSRSSRLFRDFPQGRVFGGDRGIERLENKSVPGLALSLDGIEISHPRGRVVGFEQRHAQFLAHKQ